MANVELINQILNAYRASGVSEEKLAEMKAELQKLNDTQLQQKLTEALNHNTNWGVGDVIELTSSSAQAESVDEVTEHDDEEESVTKDEVEDTVDDHGELTKRTIKNGDSTTVIEYANGFPAKKTISNNGTVIEESEYKIITQGNGTKIFEITTKRPLENKTIVTKALGLDSKGNYTDETFLSREVKDEDTTTKTEIMTGDTLLALVSMYPDLHFDKSKISAENRYLCEKISNSDGSIATLNVYNTNAVSQLDSGDAHKLLQSKTNNGTTRIAKYDGNGNTITTTNAGDGWDRLTKRFFGQALRNNAQALARKKSEIIKLNNNIRSLQAGEELLIPGEFDADSPGLVQTQSRERAKQIAANAEYNRAVARVNYESTTTEVTLSKDYPSIEAYARETLANEGITNPTKQQVNDRKNEIYVLNNSKTSFKKGDVIRTVSSKLNTGISQSLVQAGFEQNQSNFIFYQRFNQLDERQQKNVLSVIQYCISQNITDLNKIKAKILEVFPEINLFDSGKIIPPSVGFAGSYSPQFEKAPVALETFITDKLGLDLKSGNGKLLYERLMQLPQSELNKIPYSRFNISDCKNKSFSEILNMFSAYTNVHTAQEHRDNVQREMNSPNYPKKVTVEIIRRIVTSCRQTMEQHREYLKDNMFTNLGEIMVEDIRFYSSSELIPKIAEHLGFRSGKLDALTKSLLTKIDELRDMEAKLISLNPNSPDFEKKFKEAMGVSYDAKKVEQFMNLQQQIAQNSMLGMPVDNAKNNEQLEQLINGIMGDDFKANISDYLSWSSGAGTVAELALATVGMMGIGAAVSGAIEATTVATRFAVGAITMGSYSGARFGLNFLDDIDNVIRGEKTIGGVFVGENNAQTIREGAQIIRDFVTGNLSETDAQKKLSDLHLSFDDFMTSRGGQWVVNTATSAVIGGVAGAASPIFQRAGQIGTHAGQKFAEKFPTIGNMLGLNAPTIQEVTAKIITSNAAGISGADFMAQTYAALNATNIAGKGLQFLTETMLFYVTDLPMSVIQELLSESNHQLEDALKNGTLGDYLVDKLKDQAVNLLKVKSIGMIVGMMVGAGAASQGQNPFEEYETLKNSTIRYENVTTTNPDGTQTTSKVVTVEGPSGKIFIEGDLAYCYSKQGELITTERMSSELNFESLDAGSKTAFLLGCMMKFERYMMANPTIVPAQDAEIISEQTLAAGGRSQISGITNPVVAATNPANAPWAVQTTGNYNLTNFVENIRTLGQGGEILYNNGGGALVIIKAANNTYDLYEFDQTGKMIRYTMGRPETQITQSGWEGARADAFEPASTVSNMSLSGLGGMIKSQYNSFRENFLNPQTNTGSAGTPGAQTTVSPAQLNKKMASLPQDIQDSLNGLTDTSVPRFTDAQKIEIATVYEKAPELVSTMLKETIDLGLGSIYKYGSTEITKFVRIYGENPEFINKYSSQLAAHELPEIYEAYLKNPEAVEYALSHTVSTEDGTITRFGTVDSIAKILKALSENSIYTKRLIAQTVPDESGINLPRFNADDIAKLVEYRATCKRPSIFASMVEESVRLPDGRVSYKYKTADEIINQCELNSNPVMLENFSPEITDMMASRFSSEKMGMIIEAMKQNPEGVSSVVRQVIEQNPGTYNLDNIINVYGKFLSNPNLTCVLANYSGNNAYKLGLLSRNEDFVKITNAELTDTQGSRIQILFNSTSNNITEFDYTNIRNSLEQGSLKQVIETEFGDIETIGTTHSVKINKIGNIYEISQVYENSEGQYMTKIVDVKINENSEVEVMRVHTEIEASDTVGVEGESVLSSNTQITMQGISNLSAPGTQKGGVELKNGYVKQYTDANGQVIRIEEVRPSTVIQGEFEIVEQTLGEDGQMHTEVIGGVKTYGSRDQGSRSRRRITSPDGTITRQIKVAGPKGSGSEYTIVDSKGETLFNTKRQHNQISDNHYTSKVDGQKYDILFEGDKITVTKESDGTGQAETVTLDSSQLDPQLMSLYKQLPGDMLFNLAKYGIKVKLGYEANNACFSPSANTIFISAELANDPFTFAHEYGHALDRYLVNQNGADPSNQRYLMLRDDPEFVKIYNEELENFIRRTASADLGAISYFVKNDGNDPLGEFIAETTALLSGLNDNNGDLGVRSVVLQQNFPRAIAYIAKVQTGKIVPQIADFTTPPAGEITAPEQRIPSTRTSAPQPLGLLNPNHGGQLTGLTFDTPELTPPSPPRSLTGRIKTWVKGTPIGRRISTGLQNARGALSSTFTIPQEGNEAFYENYTNIFRSPRQALNIMESLGKNPEYIRLCDELARHYVETGRTPESFISDIRNCDDIAKVYQMLIEQSGVGPTKLAQIISNMTGLMDQIGEKSPELRTAIENTRSHCNRTRTLEETQAEVDNAFPISDADKISGIQHRFKIIKDLKTASMGETYIAEKPDGTKCIVKMLKKGVDARQLELEEQFYSLLIRTFNDNPESAEQQVSVISQCYKDWADELDFVHEFEANSKLAQGAQRYTVARATDLSDDGKCLVMDIARGVQMEEVMEMMKFYLENPAEYSTRYAKQIEANPWLGNPEQVMTQLPETLSKTFIEQYIFMKDGGQSLMHGDPHMGNYFIYENENGVLTPEFIDTGLCIERDADAIRSDIRFFASYAVGNTEGIAEYFISKCQIAPIDIDAATAAVEQDIRTEIFNQHTNITNFAQVQTAITQILDRHGLTIRPDEATAMKAQMQFLTGIADTYHLSGRHFDINMFLKDLPRAVYYMAKEGVNPWSEISSSLNFAFYNQVQTASTAAQFIYKRK